MGDTKNIASAVIESENNASDSNVDINVSGSSVVSSVDLSWDKTAVINADLIITMFNYIRKV